MYLDFFGLGQRPFNLTPEASLVYMTARFEEALHLLEYGIRERLGFLLVTGEVGTGKTTLTRNLLNRLNGQAATALLIHPMLNVSELLGAINHDFGNPTDAKTPQGQIESLSKFLTGLHAQGKTALVIIDEAQNLSNEALEAVRLLSNLETESAKLLQILLVGQPELRGRLASSQLRQLDQRIAHRICLKPLTFEEMVGYIQHRLALCGGGGKIVFLPKALKALWGASHGIPRVVNILCDRALIAAFLAQTFVVRHKVMRRAIEDWSEAPESIWDHLKSWVDIRVS